MSVTIRTARPDEFDAVGEVVVRAYLEGGHVRPESPYVDELRDVADRVRDAEVLVAAEGDKALGSVTVVRPGGRYAELAEPGELEFRMLAVAPEAAGRGVGRALVRTVVERAREEGSERIVLCSLQSMTVAHRLYRDLGFRRLPDRDVETSSGTRFLTFGLDLHLDHLDGA